MSPAKDFMSVIILTIVHVNLITDIDKSKKSKKYSIQGF